MIVLVDAILLLGGIIEDYFLNIGSSSVGVGAASEIVGMVGSFRRFGWAVVRGLGRKLCRQ